MQIEYTGRHTEVPPELRLLAERKLRKLARALPRITHAHVVLARDKRRESAEVTVQSSHLTLTAADESGDMAASLATVMDKLARQAERAKGKRRQRHRRAPARGTALWSAGAAPASREDGDGRPRLIRSRRSGAAKPMTVEEAMLEVESSPDGLLVFRDAATRRLSVLFRRKDGHLGLIEPEA
ncbi:MAG TPA: ribosome-associated translation inhibitor RaiA [Vicinamibacteria bacterium]